MKRRLLCTILAVTMAIAFTACGTQENTAKSVAADKQSEEAGNGEQSKDGTTGGAEQSGNETSKPAEQSETKDGAEAGEDGDTAIKEEAVKEEEKTAVEKAQEERAAAVIKEVEFVSKALPDNAALTFVSDMKAGWNLGNTLEATGYSSGDELASETSWGNPVTTQDMVDAVKAAGFETIRIPVSWIGHVTIAEDGTVTVSEAWLDRVQEVVDYAFANDMYVIINTHHDIDPEKGYYPNSENYEKSETYLSAVWTAMAERFKDYDEHLIFESLNEPRLKDTAHEWNFQASVAECKDAADCINRLNQTFVDIVRASGGNNAERYLMLPGYAASLAGVATELYQLPADTADNKLIVSVHAYTPYNFALQAPGESGSTDEFFIDKSASTADIDSLMTQLYNKFVSQGIPVVMGEYGAREKNFNFQDRLDYYVYYVSTARAHGITCCVWDNNSFSGTGENFGLLRRNVCSWLYPEIIEAILKYA